MSNRIKNFLKTKHISFTYEPFENYKTKNKFDIVLSLANHSTYDKQSKLTFRQYFSKIRSLLTNEGILVLNLILHK